MFDMIVKIFHEYLSQSRPNNLQEDLQKLEDKINTFAGQKGVVIHDIKYEKIQNSQMQYMIIAFVHHTAISEDTGEARQDDIPKVMVEKK